MCIFHFLAFSVSTLLENNNLTNIDITGALWEEVINFVADVTGLDEYFLDKSCTFDDDQFTGAVNGLNDGENFFISGFRQMTMLFDRAF